MKVYAALTAALLVLTSSLLWPAVGRAGVFRFSVSVEPNGADPARITSSESNYFLVNVLRGLYFVDAKGVARPEIAQSCKWTKRFTKLRCQLKPRAKWSDGKSIVAGDFVESWQRLVAPGTKGFGAALISEVKNAAAIHKGDAKPETLGVKAISPSILEVTLEKEHREFIELLAHPALVATRTGFSYDGANSVKAPMSGPYRVTEWKSNSRIRLESNAQYETIQKTGVTRPPVEVLTVDDDETTLNLYREGTLSFVRRLPTHYLKSLKESKESSVAKESLKLEELWQIPVARFDYVGFGPGLRDQMDFRQALAKALNYEELRVIYSALGIPGCPAIDPAWMQEVPCHKFDVAAAQAHWAKVPAALREKRWVLNFSKLGGDDVQKGMEWMQSQWKKHLGLTVDLKSSEQGVYIAGLRSDPPDLFRKGVGLDRSTCLAAVEIFENGNSENFIRLDSAEYEKALQVLRAAETEKDRRQACSNVVKQLVERAEVIPLGRIHFSMLAKPSFKGWILNPLNHLDLSHLQSN